MKRSLPSLVAAVLLPSLLACQAMAPVGSGAKGGLSGSSSVTNKPSGEELPGSSSEGSGDLGADLGAGAPPPGAASPIGSGGPIVDKDVPIYRSAIEPIVKGDPSATSGGGGRTYAWGPEAPIPPKSDSELWENCFDELGRMVVCCRDETGTLVPCKFKAEEKRPTYDPSKEREPEAFRILMGSHPFNSQEADAWPSSYDVFEDQNGFMFYDGYVVQAGMTSLKPDGTSAFAWWDILRGPTLRTLFTPKGQPVSNATYTDRKLYYRHTSGGNWNASSCFFGCDVQEGDTLTFYLYYETDPLSTSKTDFFKDPPQANFGEKPIPLPAGAYDSFVADTKHFHALGSLVIRDGNAPMKLMGPARNNRWFDQITIHRSAP